MPSSLSRAAFRAELQRARVDRLAHVAVQRRHRDGERPGELRDELPPRVQRRDAHRRGDARDAHIVEPARAECLGEPLTVAQGERAGDLRWRERHAELLADGVEDQAQPRVGLARIPDDRAVAPARAEHPRGLAHGVARDLGEHQAMADDDRVEALVIGRDAELITDERRDLRQARGPASGGLHHGRRHIAEHDVTRRADTARRRDPGAPRPGGEVEHRLSRVRAASRRTGAPSRAPAGRP